MPRIDVKALHRIMMGRNFLFKFQLANAVGMSYERLTAIIVSGEDEVEEEELARLCSGLGCERSDLVAGEQKSAAGDGMDRRNGHQIQGEQNMWEVVKIPVERLEPEAFAPFGHVIRTFEERKPDVAKGGHRSNEYPVIADPGDEPKDGPAWYQAHPDRVPISEGLQRAHFAFHTDAGQSFYPKLHSPSVFLVGPVQDDIRAEELRAFYSDGDTGVCLHLKVWHTMPICVSGRDVYQTTRGDQDYLEHSVEIDFDLERGQTIEPDMENFSGWPKK